MKSFKTRAVVSAAVIACTALISFPSHAQTSTKQLTASLEKQNAEICSELSNVFGDPNNTSDDLLNLTLSTSSAQTADVAETPDPEPVNTWTGRKLTRSAGTVTGPTGKETYYNLNMSGVVRIMRNMGFSESDYPYWVREDGTKMLGSYIMVAANLSRFPRGTTVPTSLGTGLVCDTGGFAASNPTQLDIATTW